MNEEEKEAAFKCRRCGRCCRREAVLWETDATVRDVARWMQEKRFDILKRVNPVIIGNSDIVIFDIWISPRTGEHVNRCPWLRKKPGSRTYECIIYDLRPTVCREWPFIIEEGADAGCPACRDIVASEAGEVIEFPTREPDETQ